MAVAGLHNLSAFGSSFFGESQSRRWDDEPRPSGTRSSSILQMWRELEGDHVVSHSHRSTGQRNGTYSEALSSTVSMGQGSDFETDNQEHEDNNSIISEQSSDFGEIERERVRQVFQEWMKSGAMGDSSNNAFQLNNRSGPQWLGENECERVRIIREWVQMNAQQRNNQGLLRDGMAEAGPEIEQIRDGLLITHPEIGARRPIRRLCGRQALLDLLLRAQHERKGELEGLLEQRPVSDFAHRNRIQAFLRGRFLRNETLIPDKKIPSVAATELGLLRQRHTVSGLREGFLSKLDNSTSTSANNAESDSSSSNENSGELQSTSRQREVIGINGESDLESAADGNMSQQEFVRSDDLILDSEEHEKEMSLDSEANAQQAPLNTEGSQQPVFLDVESAHSRGSRDHEEINASSITNESEIEDINYSGPVEVFHEHYASRSDASSIHESPDHTTDLDESTTQQFEGRDALGQVDELQESVIGIEEIARSWQENPADEWFQETSNNDAIVEQDQIQESHEDWPSHDLQEAIDSWLDMPSGEVGASIGRIHTFYFPDDDDNAHAMELRELFSRGRVSSLLRSGFRESLDQVLQSHVERLGHASSGDWELENAYSSPSLLEQDQGQNGNRTTVLSDDADGNLFAPTLSQPLWDEELPGENLPHNNSNHQLGTEWEVINELRIDMARLQQRLNNMQSMLEACMDMQIELQRSVRQEVSAALNLTRDGDSSKVGNMLHDESQWDHVRRGICCLCCDSNIDSLLYRCGHMCTCCKCAEKLVQGAGKCPMCRAPVVEAVRAYFTH